MELSLEVRPRRQVAPMKVDLEFFEKTPLVGEPSEHLVAREKRLGNLPSSIDLDEYLLLLRPGFRREKLHQKRLIPRGPFQKNAQASLFVGFYARSAVLSL